MTTTMRWLLSFLLLGLLSVVQALSSSGNNLLVILEELAEKSKYSKYLADLEGMEVLTLVCMVYRMVLILCNAGRGFKITYESPKGENVELFHLGEKAHDHLLILPPKSKGNVHLQIFQGRFLTLQRPWTKPHTQAPPRFHQCGRKHPLDPFFLKPHTIRARIITPRTRYPPSYRSQCLGC